ncbi:hypothetical protein [uncultured Flavobacterium sp.]|uniref:hypothetical protein n=1 Tax=uncultured Flavobacterium sp. TaxID=165435 RepID=UPI0025E96977|nr:hypothetical protein [uncultured Flavobacterium sp.]
MLQHNQQIHIQFINETDRYNEPSLVMKIDAGCKQDEMTCYVSLDNYPVTDIRSRSGTPTDRIDIEMEDTFDKMIKKALTEYPDENPGEFKFHLDIILTVADATKTQLRAGRVITLRNPFLEMKPEEWPQWVEPEFEVLEIKEFEEEASDFAITVSPQYTGGDKFAFLDSIEQFVADMSVGSPVDRVAVRTQFRHQQNPPRLAIYP